MTYACDKCRDTGKRILHVADDGAVTHSDYMDCHHCDAASQIAARAAAPAPQAVVVPPELPPLPRSEGVIEGYYGVDGDWGSVDGYTADQMRAYALQYAALASSPVAQQQNEDTARLDWLGQAAEGAHISLCFEIDGGVHCTVEPVGGEAVAGRNKNTIREAIDAARAALNEGKETQ
jgi:hypothetical protein